MAINLSKNASINVSKAAPQLKTLRVGLSWDAGSDLDVSAIVLGADKKILNPDEKHVAYYRNATGNPYGEAENPVAGVKHFGDNRDGSADGDDETISVTTDQLQAGADSVIIVVSSYSETSPVPFGSAANPVARLYDADGKVLVEVKLAEDAAFSTGFEFLSIEKNPAGDWNFKNLSNPVGSSANGLVDVLAAHR